MDLSSVIEFLGRVEPYVISSIEFVGSLGPYIPSALILVAFLIFLALSIFSKSEAISRNAPGILITLGIFFTFIGITIALFNFDPQNITRTIPELLEGLKLAFISSIAGLILSIVYRLLMILIKPITSRIGKKSSGELTAKDFYEQIENINKSIQEGNKSIKEALAGEGDASLYTQIGKLRNDFRDFAEKVAKTGTEELIKALEKVIRDFNQKITEQFGDNFKKLNEAVEKLIVWQENYKNEMKEYKNQIEKLTEIFNTVQEGIEQANKSINNIKESIEQIPQHTSKIPEHMEHLQKAFDATEQRMQELRDGLETLATVKERAEQAIPDIQKHLDNILGELQAGAERQRESINQNLASVEQLQQDVNNQVEASLQSIQAQQQQVNDHITASIQNVNTKMEEYMQAINNQMNNQIEEALKTMGNNLVPITEKLVKDYEEHQRTVSNKIEELRQSIRHQ